MHTIVIIFLYIDVNIYICRTKNKGTLSFLRFFYFTHKRYGVQVNIGWNLHMSYPVCPPGAMHVLLHKEVTPNIDLDSMKYKGSLIFGSAYIIT